MKKAWIPTTLSSLLGLGLAAGLLWGCGDFLNNSDKSAAQGKEPDTTSELVGKTAALLTFRPGHDPKTHCAALYELENGNGGTYFVSPESQEWVGPEWNDKISSVTVAKGCVITLYVNAKYRGTPRNYAGPDVDDKQNQKLYPSLGNGPFGYNNTFSSFKCDCKDMATGNNAGTAWDEAPGRGAARKLLYYDPKRIQSMLDLKFNDRAKHITVNPGYMITLWDNVWRDRDSNPVGYGPSRTMRNTGPLIGLANKVSAFSVSKATPTTCQLDWGCFSNNTCDAEAFIKSTENKAECFKAGGNSWCQDNDHAREQLCLSK